jgi:hypothetical protein
MSSPFQDRPAARESDGRGEAGAVTFDVWDRRGRRGIAEVSCDRDAIVSVTVRLPEDDRHDFELDAGSAHALAEHLRAKAAEGTRILTDRMPRKVFDDAHRYDKGGGPSW